MTTFRGTGITIVPTKTDLPNAADFPGIAVINDTNSILISDGSTWSPEFVQPSFIGSIYSGSKSATTTVTNQSEKKATGTMVIKVENISTTNNVYIGIGQSNSEAEYNAGSGTNNATRFMVPLKRIGYINISDYTHYSWLGGDATVPVIITQGV